MAVDCLFDLLLRFCIHSWPENCEGMRLLSSKKKGKLPQPPSGEISSQAYFISIAAGPGLDPMLYSIEFRSLCWSSAQVSYRIVFERKSRPAYFAFTTCAHSCLLHRHPHSTACIPIRDIASFPLPRVGQAGQEVRSTRNSCGSGVFRSAGGA